MMRTVHLHGALGQKYGFRHRFDVETAAEAVRALATNFQGFADDIAAGSWQVVRGPAPDSGFTLDLDQVGGFRLGQADVHIVPALAGSKNDGVLKTIVGVALIGVSFGFAGALAAPISSTLFGSVTWGNAIGMLGLSMTLQGISTLLAPESDEEDQKESILSAVSNSAPEGTAVPVIYGEIITQGVVISSGIDIDQVDQSGNVVVPADTTTLLTDTYGDQTSAGTP